MISVAPMQSMAHLKMQTCPRRMHDFGPWDRKPFQDEWRDDDTCSFCGSLNPVTLMRRLEAGDVALTPTDKTYKLYVENQGGAQFKQTYRTDHDQSGDQTKWEWTTREVSQAKFYFQHLDEGQMARFVELFNQRKLKLKYPGYFYATPYFMSLGPVPSI